MALSKRKVVYTLTSLVLVACISLAVVTWRARSVRFRATLTIEDVAPLSATSQRRMSDLVYIAESWMVLNEATDILCLEMWTGSQEQPTNIDALYSCKVRQEGRTNRLFLQATSRDKAAAELAVQALSRGFIRRYQEIVDSGSDDLIAGKPSVSRIHVKPFSLHYLVAICRPFG